MPYNDKSTKELLNYHIHEAVGLDDSEARFVISLCRKFDNCRDEIDDLYPMALISIMQAFESKARKNEPIRNRRNFIQKTVYFSMCAQVVRKNKKDLIYRSVNLFRSDILEDSETDI